MKFNFQTPAQKSKANKLAWEKLMKKYDVKSQPRVTARNTKGEKPLVLTTNLRMQAHRLPETSKGKN